jgi:hypothetical protein
MIATETTRFIQAVISLLLGVGFVALTAITKTPETTWAVALGALGMFIFSGTSMWMNALTAYDSHITTCENYAEVFGKLDDEARAAMGFLFPKMRYVMKRGIVREEFEDTGLSIELFRVFLQTSNDKYISPRRDWYGKGRPESAWVTIFKWLEERDYVIPDTAAGSHSWLWKGNAYKHLCAYWMAGRKPVDMGEWVVAPQSAYAQEVDDVELSPPPPEEGA